MCDPKRGLADLKAATGHETLPVLFSGSERPLAVHIVRPDCPTIPGRDHRDRFSTPARRDEA
jgi:hypothetical protein